MEQGYFQVTCKQCHRAFSVKAEAGATVKCNCPFCGSETTVAIPLMQQNQTKAQQPNQQIGKRKTGDNIARCVIIGFVIIALGLLLISTLLYAVFTAMSN
ncbi:hypothetical protein [Prevotella ihumii]|uniref:hypothetical protein n=1 Tax=Prevotella ihumii TaxID=1917878 RepID=UPI000981C328|nr:hypothetical protein [Prevotella ihumii]